MKLPLLLFFQLILLQSVFAQEPPPRFQESADEVSTRNAFVKTYQISNVIKGSTLLHSNKFFSLHCKNKGELNDYKGYIWMLNAKEIFNKTEHTFYDGKQPGVAIFGFEKQFYAKKSSQQELKYFGYNETFDSWNLEKIGEYYFTYSPMKFPLPSNGNLKKSKFNQKI